MSTLPPSSLNRRRTMNNDDEYAEDDEDSYEKRHPRKIIKTFLMAIFLFITGSLMLYYGVKILQTDYDRAVGMIVVGSLAFLPGSYASYNLFGAWRQWPGFSYDSVPSYDD